MCKRLLNFKCMGWVIKKESPPNIDLIYIGHATYEIHKAMILFLNKYTEVPFKSLLLAITDNVVYNRVYIVLIMIIAIFLGLFYFILFFFFFAVIDTINTNVNAFICTSVNEKF